MDEKYSWLILGAGAIGTYIGGSLILHGQKVVFIEQSQAARSILENGLRLNIHGQEHRILHPEIFSNLSDAFSLTPFDYSIFALKSYDTQSALNQIKPYSNDFPPVLCVQNGVENEPAIAKVLSPEKVIAGTVTSAVSRRGAGDILLERMRGIGIASGNAASQRIQSVFTRAGLNAHLYLSADSMKWSKMLTNLMANASSAILDMTPSEILAHPGLYSFEIAQLREALRISHALEIHLTDLPGTPVRLFAWLINSLQPRLSHIFISSTAGRGRGQKMPSFHIDLHTGRGKCEVNYLNGAVVRFGDRLGVPTPINRWLNVTLMKLVQEELPISEYAHQPQKYLDQLSQLDSE